jgi:hypothetical protein
LGVKHVPIPGLGLPAPEDADVVGELFAVDAVRQIGYAGVRLVGVGLARSLIDAPTQVACELGEPPSCRGHRRVIGRVELFTPFPMTHKSTGISVLEFSNSELAQEARSPVAG